MSGAGVERSVWCGVSLWTVPDDLWDRLEPLLPQRERRFRYPGRKPLPDREVLCGILYVLHTGIQWEYLPKELGFGSGMTCWRRLRDRHAADVRQWLHEVLLTGGNRNDVAADPTHSSPTTTPTAARSAPAASSPPSPAVAPRTVRDWAPTAGP